MKTVKGIKAFNKDMTCRGFQYKEGKTYKTDKARMCESGFHFCTNPFDVLNYYDICESEFAEVEASGKIIKQKDGDSKISATEIKIGVRIGLSGFVESAVNFLIDFCKKKNNSGDSSQLASSGDYSRLASSGDYSRLASSGDYSQLASSGNSSRLASSGDYSQLASSGDSSRLASSGDYSQLASSGDSSRLASSGDYSRLASSGDYSQLASSGDSSRLALSGNSSRLAVDGKFSVGADIGINGKAKGKKGNWITLAEWEYSDKENKYIPICVKSVKITGKKIKEDTWYKLKNSKFTEVE